MPRLWVTKLSTIASTCATRVQPESVSLLSCTRLRIRTVRLNEGFHVGEQAAHRVNMSCGTGARTTKQRQRKLWRRIKIGH
eukprot:6012325-Amphidinium_carterae.1